MYSISLCSTDPLMFVDYNNFIAKKERKGKEKSPVKLSEVFVNGENLPGNLLQLK